LPLPVRVGELEREQMAKRKAAAARRSGRSAGYPGPFWQRVEDSPLPPVAEDACGVGGFLV
jgi:hypothetical protein